MNPAGARDRRRRVNELRQIWDRLLVDAWLRLTHHDAN